MKIKKAWGETEKIFERNGVTNWPIFVNKGGYCSKHKHKTKVNGFYIFSGKLEITTWDKLGHEHKTVLGRGDSTYIDIEIYHRFLALTDVTGIEIYYTNVQDDDIVRESLGGMREM